LGTIVIAAAVTLSAGASDCPSPILPGVWKVRSEVIRGVWSGTAPFGELEPGMDLVAVVRSGEFVIEGDRDASRIQEEILGQVSYQLERSTDLKSWVPHDGPLTASGPESTVEIAVDTGEAAVFIRVRVEP